MQNVSQTVERVAGEPSPSRAQLDDVVFVKENLYSCSESGLGEIKEATRANGLDRVVVAACTLCAAVILLPLALIVGHLLARGLDVGSAFEILSIDIADVDVGENVAEIDVELDRHCARGRREIKIDKETKLIEFSGVIRRWDVKADNTVASELVADAEAAVGSGPSAS